MDFKNIENRLLSLSKYIKEVSIIEFKKKPFVFIYPDFEKLKQSRIINIEEEILWYAIELYNMEVDLSDRLDHYKVLTRPLPKNQNGDFDKKILKKMIENEDLITSQTDQMAVSKECKELITYLKTFSKKEVSLNSHIELDLGLDSLNYIELFLYVENSFGVKIDETVFAELMIVQDLCRYIEKNKLFDKHSDKKLSNILKEPINKKLIFSPINMFLWKYILYPIFKIYFRLELKGEKNIPKTPCIFAPTHQSMLDGFFVLTTLPFSVLKKTFFLSYKNTFGRSILKPIAIHGQNILIDPNDNLKETIKYTALSVKEKNNLVIFPEGARSRNRQLLKFKPFFAILSKTFNVPVVPIVVDGGFEALRSGRYFPKPKKVKVTYLEPIYPDSLSVKEITERTKEAIDAQMKKDPVKL